jgi:phosphocarrier protein
MISKEIVVSNKIGIHARPASQLVRLGTRFKSKITVHFGNKTASIKSIIALLTLKIKVNNTMIVTADGEDEAEALQEVTRLVESGFGEK